MLNRYTYLQQVQRVPVLVCPTEAYTERMGRLFKDAPLIEYVLYLLGLVDGRLVHDLWEESRDKGRWWGGSMTHRQVQGSAREAVNANTGVECCTCGHRQAGVTQPRLASISMNRSNAMALQYGLVQK
jgi:hypothetical protein